MKLGALLPRQITHWSVIYSVLFLIFAASFAYVQNEAAGIEQSCFREQQKLANLKISAELGQLKTSITMLRLDAAFYELVRLNPAKTETAENAAVRRQLQQTSEQQATIYNDISKSMKAADAICKESSDQLNTVTWQTIVITLLGTLCAFWAGLRKTDSNA